MSPAEVQFVRVMGGRVLFSTSLLRDYRTGFPLTIMSLGPVLKAELVQREVRVGAMYIDFGVETPWYCKGIEVDGSSFHGDVVRERERDEYCARYGWQLLHIPAADLWHYPNHVHDRVIRFLGR